MKSATTPKTLRFEGRCPRCEGSGLWQGRKGYPCRGCNATGTIMVAAKQVGGGWTFRVISAKGNVTKETYYAAAELTAPLLRYNAGATIGGGHYSHYTHTDPEGSACFVYGLLEDGELTVALPKGGFASTGLDTHGQEIQVRVTDKQAAIAIEELQQ